MRSYSWSYPIRQNKLYLLRIWTHLEFFASRGEEFYSPETLALFVNKAKENYANGTIPKASFQTMRKAARWIEECLSTGRVSQRKLRKYNFACAPPEFENLLSQYQLYMDNENYLKEGTRQFYLSSVRTFSVLWAFGNIPLC